MNIILSILILGAIILIHELGHFLMAKVCGIGVVEFSLGMGPRSVSYTHLDVYKRQSWDDTALKEETNGTGTHTGGYYIRYPRRFKAGGGTRCV